MIRRALGRGSYGDRHEREAELIATIIMEWASVVDYETPHRSDTAAARKLEALFNDRPRLAVAPSTPISAAFGLLEPVDDVEQIHHLLTSLR